MSQATLPTVVSVTSQRCRKRVVRSGERQQARARRIGRQEEARDQRAARKRQQSRSQIRENEGARSAGCRHDQRAQADCHQREGPERQSIDQRPPERAPQSHSEAIRPVESAVEGSACETPADRMTRERGRAQNCEQPRNQSEQTRAVDDPLPGVRDLAWEQVAPSISSALRARNCSLRDSRASR